MKEVQSSFEMTPILAREWNRRGLLAGAFSVGSALLLGEKVAHPHHAMPNPHAPLSHP